MKVSVIIAAYRGEIFIEEQLQSIFHQTLLPDEILIGDDSPDLLTKEVIEKCRRDCPQRVLLRYIKNEKQLGFLQNFLHLATLAEGEYIFFCDQDDVWLPEKIRIMTEKLDEMPYADLIFSDSCKVSGDLSAITSPTGSPCHFDVLSDPEKSIDMINSGKSFPVFQEYINRAFIAGHNMAMRKKALPLLLSIPEEYTFHDMWCCRIFPYLEKICCKPEILTYHRIHNNNTSALPFFHKKIFFIPRRLWEVAASGTDDLKKVLRLYKKLHIAAVSTAGKESIPEANKELLDKHIAFTRYRLMLHKHFFLCRWKAVLKHKALYREYYPETKFPLFRDLFSWN